MYPWKPWKIFWSTEIFFVSVFLLVSADRLPDWSIIFEVSSLDWEPDIVRLGKNSLLDIFSFCFIAFKFSRSALSFELFCNADFTKKTTLLSAERISKLNITIRIIK